MTEPQREAARTAMHRAMYRNARALLGSGYVRHFYEDSAADFIAEAEAYAEEVARLAAAEARSLRVDLSAAIAHERKRARLARLKARRANRTHLYRFLGRSADGAELSWEGPAVDSRAELVTVSAAYFWASPADRRHARDVVQATLDAAAGSTNGTPATEPASDGGKGPQAQTSGRTA